MGVPRHGGDLDEARRLFPGAPEPWIDLSTGINPVPYPLPTLPATAFTRLPGPGLLAEVERAAAGAYGVDDPACVVAAPGTGALIAGLPRLLPPGEVAVLGPTYAEHARAWGLAGHAVRTVPDLEAARGAAVVVAVNPNNPDGRVLTRPALEAAAGELAARGGLLVVDEAFMDFEAELGRAVSLAPALPPGALVLRSFGKPYGLAGVRLGFAVAHSALARPLREALGPWPVSGPALHAGLAALPDAGWRARAARERAADAIRLDSLATRSGLRLEGGTALFRLYLDGTSEWQKRLTRAGVWGRSFEGRPDWVRLGLPSLGPGWARVEACLSRVAGGGSVRNAPSSFVGGRDRRT